MRWGRRSTTATTLVVGTAISKAGAGAEVEEEDEDEGEEGAWACR